MTTRRQQVLCSPLLRKGHVHQTVRSGARQSEARLLSQMIDEWYAEDYGLLDGLEEEIERAPSLCDGAKEW
ncbi:MAG: hypothetical protein OEZ58_01460 [Gammaproteobacteria bacterium]|nr:hypothetical protein [Gammaproteobacteria bacterium]MDH5727643.1 hypothetical protein [Gammaproteobacteria bacterium]